MAIQQLISVLERQYGVFTAFLGYEAAVGVPKKEPSFDFIHKRQDDGISTRDKSQMTYRRNHTSGPSI